VSPRAGIASEAARRKPAVKVDLRYLILFDL
jgi:hypothetical protein